MATCPDGHDSTTDDYCDTCGLAIRSAVRPTPDPRVVDDGDDRCVVCGARLQGGRFCEECGHDNALPAPDRPAVAEPGAVWTAVVRADRAWYDEVRGRQGPDLDRIEFPRYCPDRRFELTGPRMAIGRYSRSRGVHPEIDLSGPPLDPGVSAQHALLLARPDGGWELVDLGSTNGTSVGTAARPMAPHTPVRLADGDRIRLGAWTTITVQVTRSR